jgi:hypothetical protein
MDHRSPDPYMARFILLIDDFVRSRTEPAMPKNNVSDLITDQEIAFARLVLSGKMTDRQAAEAAGLNPDTAAYTKAKPRVRDWMLDHRAAVEQQLVEQDTQELRRFNLSRDQILFRLWEIANMDPERTRNSMTAQIKAISIIVAIEGHIPDRRTAQKQPAPPFEPAKFYKAAWNRKQEEGNSVDSETPTAEAQEEKAPDLRSTSGSADVPQAPPARPASSVPRVPAADYVAPDTRVRF